MDTKTAKPATTNRQIDRLVAAFDAILTDLFPESQS